MPIVLFHDRSLLVSENEPMHDWNVIEPQRAHTSATVSTVFFIFGYFILVRVLFIVYVAYIAYVVYVVENLITHAALPVLAGFGIVATGGFQAEKVVPISLF